MGYKSPRTYVLSGLHSTGLTPVDATTYYAGGSSPTVSISSTIMRIYIPISGVIRQIVFDAYCSVTDGSNEAWIVSLYDGTTSSAIATVASATARRTWFNQNLKYPVTAGGYIQFVTTTPTWATNPDGLKVAWWALIEYE